MTDKEKIPNLGTRKVETLELESPQVVEGVKKTGNKVSEVMKHTNPKIDKLENEDGEVNIKEGDKKSEVEYSLYSNHGKFEIPQDDQKDLSERIDKVAINGYQKIGKIQKALASYFIGHEVASEKDYNCGTASYSTKTSLVEVNGNKYFVVYNYPGSSRHRKPDTGCRKAWGEKALKATEEDWRKTFTSRSLIPAHAGENDRIVVMPFIPNVSLIDILEKHEDGKFNGDYEYGRNYKDIEAKRQVVQEVSSALKELHDDGKTWGEIIPANLGVTKEGKVLFFDPETPYLEGTSEIEQKARDIWSWCMSSCGALSKSKDDNYDNYPELIKDILDAYGDKEVVDYMKENLSKKLSFWKLLRHPIAWGHFKARLTVSGRKQYNAVMKAIRNSGTERTITPQ